VPSRAFNGDTLSPENPWKQLSPRAPPQLNFMANVFGSRYINDDTKTGIRRNEHHASASRSINKASIFCDSSPYNRAASPPVRGTRFCRVSDVSVTSNHPGNVLPPLSPPSPDLVRTIAENIMLVDTPRAFEKDGQSPVASSRLEARNRKDF